MMRQGWGQENPAFRQLFTSLFIPGGTHEQMQWFNDLQRITTSPTNAVRIRQAVDDIDITDLFRKWMSPRWYCIAATMQSSRSTRDAGSRLAFPAHGSLLWKGRNHVPLKGEPAWDRLVQEMQDFLRT